MPFEFKGLTSDEAKKSLVEHGTNSLPEKPRQGSFKLFLYQLKSPFVYVLLVAGMVTLTLHEVADSIIIFIAILVNTILGFIQEKRAGDALAALKNMVHPKANVLRDGKMVKIDVENVVPGDLVILNQGDKVPADGELLEARRLFLSEALLTGESVPVVKKKGDSVFMGTVVTTGRGYVRVRVTGAHTQIGKIAMSVQDTTEQDTPLRKQLNRFSKELSVLVLGLTVFVFLVGSIVGLPLVEMFTTSVALAVSAIPEGLLVGLTVVLAIGMQRIVRKKGLVRNLVSAETLGGVTTICVDKTGTLTEGRMRVVTTIGDEKMMAKQAQVANDLDDPIVIASYEWAQKVRGAKVGQKKYQQIDELPFSSKERFFASLNEEGSNNTIYVNGAPEYLMKWSNISSEEKDKLKNEVKELAEKGMRVMGMAKKNVAKSVTRLSATEVKKDLEWVGVLAFSDPVRKGVKEALEQTKRAGIKLVVITGDYAETALHVVRELGVDILEKTIMLGSELESVDVDQLAAKLSRGPVSLFARTTPTQKLKIVDALKKNGEVVAMMGDGVNDAPALSKADIGIVVGEATDVARESSDLVLLDSSFATIAHAVEEGRGIFDNIRKIILYLMSDAFEEIFAVVGTIILGLPLPVTAAQILWINLVSDGLPDLALTVDPKRPGIMDEKPRSPKERLVSSWMMMLMGLVSITGGVLALIVFIYVYNQSGQDIILARSAVFATLGVNSLVYVFSIKTLRNPFWKENPLDNKFLIAAVVGGFGLQILPFVSSSVGRFFGVAGMPLLLWGLVFTASFIMFIVIEGGKVIFRKW